MNNSDTYSILDKEKENIHLHGDSQAGLPEPCVLRDLVMTLVLGGKEAFFKNWAAKT